LRMVSEELKLDEAVALYLSVCCLLFLFLVQGSDSVEYVVVEDV
jgi:hypothetical protein